MVLFIRQNKLFEDYVLEHLSNVRSNSVNNLSVSMKENLIKIKWCENEQIKTEIFS